MATSTIQAVLVGLIAKFNTLTFTGLTTNDPNVVVYDGFPGPNQPDNLIVVGGTPNNTVDGGQTYAGLGAQVKYEDYEVECFISCWVGGDDSQGQQGASDAQNTARNNAFLILAQIEAALKSDLRLLSVPSPPGILWLEIGRTALEETSADNAADGRFATIQFNVHVHGRI